MKNYDETINSVFSRMEEYKTLQKRKKRHITKLTFTISCVCLAVLSGVAIWNSIRPDIPKQAINDALYPGIKDVIHDKSDVTNANTEQSTNVTSSITASTNKIVINKIDNISYSTMDIALMLDDFVAMNEAELNEYYDINVFPNTIPSDLENEKEQQYGIYKRNKGTGELYHDVNNLRYFNNDNSRSINIEISKGQLPFACVILEHHNIQKSTINGTDVDIAVTSEGFYYVEFMYMNVGFRIITEGLREEELIEVIGSITEA